MVTFYDFPKEHWKHLRTTNIIESPFATARLRIGASKRFKKVQHAALLIGKILTVAESNWRTLNAPELLQKVLEGVKFKDGNPLVEVEVYRASPQRGMVSDDQLPHLLGRTRLLVSSRSSWEEFYCEKFEPRRVTRLHPLEMAYRLYKHYGLISAVTVSCNVLTNRTQFVRLPGIEWPMMLRPKTSDTEVFCDVFLKRLYRFKSIENPRVIIDAGANIGMTTLFFASQFPDSRIIALEPFASNYSLLKKNTQGYRNVQCLEAALWSEDGFVEVQGSPSKGWGAEVSQPSLAHNSDTRAVSIPSLLTEWDIETIDILKIDIEGSEKEVFTENPDAWLNKVHTLVIEIHDRKKAGCSKAVFSALSRASFSCRIRGDNLICRNLEFHRDENQSCT